MFPTVLCIVGQCQEHASTNSVLVTGTKTQTKDPDRDGISTIHWLRRTQLPWQPDSQCRRVQAMRSSRRRSQHIQYSPFTHRLTGLKTCTTDGAVSAGAEAWTRHVECGQRQVGKTGSSAFNVWYAPEFIVSPTRLASGVRAAIDAIASLHSSSRLTRVPVNTLAAVWKLSDNLMGNRQTRQAEECTMTWPRRRR